MLAALVAIPMLIHRIGDTRFGFLAIAWMLIGYFGLFDLGIGRALTYGVARRLARDPAADTSDLEWTGLSALGVMGVLVGLAIALLSDWLVFRLIRIQPELRGEAATAFLVLSAAVPFVVLTAGLRGILEARQAFRSINLVMMPLGVLLYAGPLVVSLFSVSLPHVLLSLLLVRLASAVALFLVCWRTIRGFLTIRLRRSALKELLSFGGWMTVSNVVSPVMVNMDRLFIGSLMSVTMVTYYVTPFEIITKLLVVPSSIANASFPEFSQLARGPLRREMRRYFVRILGILLLLLIPPALVGLVFAHDVLRLWVSPELADRSAGIMRLLAAGVVVNGLTYLPFAFVQGLGRSDVTARCHLLELAVYVPALVILISWLGLMGAALAWVLRVSIDASLLFAYAWSHLREPADAR